MNYFYFGFYFFFISFLSALTYCSLPEKSFLFLFYSLMQTLLETLFLLFCAKLLKKYLTRIYRFFFPLFLFCLLITHGIGFLLVQLMDTSFIFAFQNLLSQGITGFFISLRTFNLSPFFLLIFFLSFSLFPIITSFLYLICENLSLKKPFHLSNKSYASLIGLSLFFFISCDALVYYLQPTSAIIKYQKKLPFTRTLFKNHPSIFRMTKTLPPPRKEENIFAYTNLQHLEIKDKPNIYLFIIETFREDFTDNIITPNLYRFKQSEISFPLSLSNSNASQISWFSIFHSHLPFYWKEQNKTWNEGAIPLRIFKKMGYQIHLLSSAELSYHKMGEHIFGKDRYLLDEIQDFTLDHNLLPCDRDHKAINHLLQLIKKRP